MIRYNPPRDWIRYSPQALTNLLAEAKASVLSLRTVPYQRRWVEELQAIELKREVAGTSRIEGAEFTEQELDAAIAAASPAELVTRSQRQAQAAVRAYRWIAGIPDDRPTDADLIREVHRLIVLGADDDHCPPGQLRRRDQNVHFGSPRHRGAEGGEACTRAFAAFVKALQHEYRQHDPILQALAAHYHLAAMHPFLDGNGRTARALEALLLQRAGLRDTAFIARSNYYYDEKNAYLSALADVGRHDHDLTAFMRFALRGVALQSQRLLGAIQHQISKELFRNLMFDLFHRLETPRKRVIAERQIEVLKLLLDVSTIDLTTFAKRTEGIYQRLKSPSKARLRDLAELSVLGAIRIWRDDSGKIMIGVRLEWPTEITETDFFRRVRELPKARTHPFLP
jgi:Fic family protein